MFTRCIIDSGTKYHYRIPGVKILACQTELIKPFLGALNGESEGFFATLAVFSKLLESFIKCRRLSAHAKSGSD